jgi:rare lipoprotein A
VIGNSAMRRAVAMLALFIVAIWLEGCASRPPAKPRLDYPKPYRIGKNWHQPLPDAKGFRERGLASWYGKDFHGRKTASGERYNMYAMTAAHKTLPLGTYVQVVNLENNRRAKVRINDRGPFARGRIIDLSYQAAQKLGIAGKRTARGTAKVEIVALDAGSAESDAAYIPANCYSGNFTIEVDALLNSEDAKSFRQKSEDHMIQNGYDGIFAAAE